mgnify:CR=1 FL=1
MGFFGGFQIAQAGFFLVFALVFGVFVFTAVRGIRQWNRNNHSPRLNVAARVAAKRTQVDGSHHTDANGMVMHSSSTTYYATFEFDSGDRLELMVPRDQYGYLAEGDRGILQFQGTRFLSFVRQ